MNIKKKSLLIYLVIPIIIFSSSCSDDEGPTPVATFTQDKLFALANEEIVFTSTSTDGSTFEWDFGDGNSGSEESFTHSYSNIGTFTVTLTAIGSGGLRSNSSAIVTIGVRGLVGIDLNRVPELNSMGSPRDDDGTGPDLQLGVGVDMGQQSLVSIITIGQDIDLSSLPLSGDLEGSDINFTDTAWIIALVDNDEPFEEFESNEQIILASLNPTTNGEVDSMTGAGNIPIIVSGNAETGAGALDINLRFQIRLP